MRRTVPIVAFSAAMSVSLSVAVAPLRSQVKRPETAAAWNAEALEAYQAKDYARFLEDERRAMALEPTNPRFVYNVACGEALRGNAAEAVQLLDRLLARKLDLGAEQDTDFASIRSTPEWKAFVSRLAELRQPLVHSDVAFTLPDRGLQAVGLAIDPKTHDVFIASCRQRKILRRTKDGVVSDFIRTAQDGFLSGAQLAIDPRARLLYATTASVPYIVDYRKEEAGQSGVFAFDLQTGKLARKVMLAADGKRHFLNALVIDHAGNVYISDTGSSGIYLLRPGASALEVFVSPDLFRASQGLAFSDDEKTLFVVDFTDGLWALDMALKKKRHIDGPADIWFSGLDGIARIGNDFITVQIGPQPPRVLRLRLDPQEQKIVRVDILEMSHPDYEDPIQGIVDGTSFLYVANTELSLGNFQTGAFAADRARPTVVLRLPL